MSQTRIVLVVDNPFRDLPGLVLVARELARQGARVFLVPMNLLVRELWTLAPDFVLLNYLRANNEAAARQIQEAGITVGVLNTEGGVFTPRPARSNSARVHADAGGMLPAMEEYAFTMAGDAEVRSRVACYCAWSTAFADYAVEAGWYRRDQLKVTGMPRFDLYAIRWRNAALRFSTYVEAYPAPRILLNGNFALSNPQFQTPQQEADMMIERYGYDRSYIQAWQNNEAATMHGFVRLANRLTRENRSASVIVRPHPFENLSVYESLLDAQPNLKVVRQGTVDGWLLRASVLIHRGCSTALEARLAGVHPVELSWLPCVPVPAAEAVSIQTASEDAAADCVRDILQGTFRTTAGQEEIWRREIDRTYFKQDGESYRRVASAVLDAVSRTRDRARIEKQCARNAYETLQWGGSQRKKVRAMLSRRCAVSIHYSFRHFKRVFEETLPWDSSEKRFNAVTVQEMLDAFDEAALAVDSVKVQARPCRDSGDYRLGFREGRSVVIAAKSQ
jgi:surface carbohydrate biosynthesis protein